MLSRLQGQRRLTIQEKDALRVQKIEQKDKQEDEMKGGYERLYPVPEQQMKLDPHHKELQANYDYLIEASKQLMGEFGNQSSCKKRIVELDKAFNRYRNVPIVKNQPVLPIV